LVRDNALGLGHAGGGIQFGGVALAVAHKTVDVDLRSIGGSALTDDIDVPEAGGAGIPVTYVPARNTIMLSLALGWAEVLGANDIFCGVNAV
ncbi:7-cyano-7-deazaguanine synthase, partial [Enterobacter hormaechei]|uniref:7-cyano-7-deazaguanine synthase n=1 Tax=Enterobacter hormaechei TaxID=158836 RepID=UPI0020423E69